MALTRVDLAQPQDTWGRRSGGATPQSDCAGIERVLLMDIQMASVLDRGPAGGGTGSSDVPLKKPTSTHLVKQWKLRNQPWPSTPYSGAFDWVALRTLRTVRSMSASRRRPTSRFQPGMAGM